MGIDLRVEKEDGKVIAGLGDGPGCFAKFLVMVPTDHTVCLRFIDPYGNTIFNALQIPVLESEIAAAMPGLSIDPLVVFRERQLAHALRVGWQETVVEEMRRDLGTPASRSEELAAVKAHMSEVLGLLAQAREEGPHTYVRCLGD